MTPNREQMLSALVTLVTALFLISVAPGLRHRRIARRVAIVVYSAVFLGVLAWVVLWFLGARF